MSSLFERPKGKVHPIILLSYPFLTILVDWLHCVELGISQDAAGNVLWQAVHKAGFLPGASREARLTHLNGMLRAFNAELKPSNPIQLLTENMIKSAGKSPKLKSKGAESRGLRLWIKQLAERLAQHNPSEAHIRMSCCIDALVACSSFVDREPFDLGEFQRTGGAHLEHYAWLSQHFAGEDLWRYKPKHHQFSIFCTLLPQSMGLPTPIGVGQMNLWGDSL